MEYGGRHTSGDQVGVRDLHTARSGLHGMGRGGRDQASRGGRGGVARRGGMAGGRDG